MSVNQEKRFEFQGNRFSYIKNVLEQERLIGLVSELMKMTKRGQKPLVLDLGAGTGNLSLKFIRRGCKVVAADVSQESLKTLKDKANYNDLLEVMLTSEKLPFLENTFDITATYSVLHHIPDYLNTFKEMIRVTKPGGLIFIDFEANENRYFPENHLKKYYSLLNIFQKEDPNRDRDGEIHIWPDDHVEWEEIKKITNDSGCEIVLERDYLMYQPKGGVEIYKKFKDKCDDMKSIIIRKNV